MPARLSKRQQRELEELTHADEEARFISAPAHSAFAALLNEDGGSTEEDSAPEGHSTPSKAKKKSKKKKKKGAPLSADGVSAVQGGSVHDGDRLTETHSAIAKTEPDPTPSTSSPSVGVSKKERKALKKQKAKARKDGDDDFDRVLDELSNKYRDTHLASPTSSKGKGVSSRSLPEECYKLLSVSLSHLNPDIEMRRFFGAKVIATSRNEAGSPSSRSRRQPITQRSNLTHPQPNWWPAKLREGLTLRPLTDDEAAEKATVTPWSNSGEKYWTAEYSKKYKGATSSFMRTVLSGDPEGFYTILRHLPWHADTLLQLAELYIHREEHSQAADFIERALFTYERAFVGAFTFTNGLNRLDFDRVENRPFFLALHRQVIDLQRRGLYRTAFEFAKLLLSLDPWSDPHGALLHLDFLAIKCAMHSWLLSFSEVFSSKTSGHSSELEEPQSGYHPVCVLPGWAYARALAFRAEGDDHASQSTKALRKAILEFPSVVPLLADKAEITLSAEARSHPAFRIFTHHGNDLAEESLLHLLSHIYVQRSHALWKDPARSSWFAETVTELVQTGQLPSKSTAATGFSRLQSLVRRSGNYDTSVYRHVVVLGSSAQRLLPFIPAHAVDNNNLACDPLPPPTSKSQYDDNFFRGAEDAFGTSFRRRSAAQTQRLLEGMVPDPVLRRQLQFAQLIGNLPEQELQDLLVNAQIWEEGAAQGLPGDNFVQLNFGGEADIDIEMDDPTAAGAREGIPAANDAPVLDEDEQEDDEELEEIAPLPIRVLRNLVGRFWGSNAEEEGSSEDEAAELDGVD
ncbi:transcriptional repressor TCF25-domain-containing protein [Russula aff. rugulosa BPL654]|nr:transcriptional repressor TCF25-domain-containing protein [Russula aff. rugulosa BPL654]